MRKTFVFIVVVAHVLISCTLVEQRRETILKYLSAMPSRKDHRVISGQFIGWGEDATMKDVSEIYRKSGKWVGFLGADYHCLKYDRHHFSHVALQTNIAVTNKVIVDYGVKFVFFSQHLNNPFTDSSAWDTTGNLSFLLKDGEPKHRLDLQLDLMASGYKELENHGIVIFLRPFHEMNGSWFWWGNKDSVAFIALWKYVYDYYTVKKNLKNLIWCYSPCLWPVKYLTWYPGPQYVDVICIDAYTDIIHPYFDEAYRQLTALNKPIGLGEFGPCDASDWEGKKPCSFDYDRLIKEIRQYYPQFVFFMTWDQHWGMAHHNKIKDLLENEWVVNKDETEKW